MQRVWPGTVGGMNANATLVEIGLANRQPDGVIRWNEKGQAIAAATHADRAATLVREVAAMSLEVEDDLEEAGR